MTYQSRNWWQKNLLLRTLKKTLITDRSSRPDVLCKKGVLILEILQNSQENTCARVSFLIEFIKKETLAQVLSCESWEFSRNNFCTEHLRWLLLPWGFKKDPITRDPEKNPIKEKPKEYTIAVTSIDSSINEDSQELQGPQWLLRRKLTLLGILVMANDRAGDGDKISKDNFGLGRSR